MLFFGFSQLTASAEALTDSYTFEYYKDGNWHSFSGKFEDVKIEALRIKSPSGQPYYLSYKVYDDVKLGFFPAVSSLKDDYAGICDNSRNVRRVAIEVYSQYGTPIKSGIVVMYRSKTDEDGWLSWVSNSPDSMLTVQEKYGLGGSLDLNSTDAGYSKKDLTGFEIHIFDEGYVPEAALQYSNSEIFPQITAYSAGWKSNSSKFEGKFSALRISTDKDKPYYLSYSTFNNGNKNNDFYSPVKSNDASNGAYAGVDTLNVNCIKIEACRVGDNAVITQGVVVMYRTKVNGYWLPWVSNANSDYMAYVQRKYGLTGIIDYSSSFAGLKTAEAEGFEIQVFEVNDLIETELTDGQKLINTPIISQLPEYPTGCESISSVMALNYWGVGVTPDTFIGRYLDLGDKNSFNPNITFGGNPTEVDGMGCYAPVIEKAINRAIGGRYLRAETVYNLHPEELCKTYIDNNIPVILWASIDMKKAYSGKLIAYNGENIRWIAPEHCLLLVGYDAENYIFCDPLNGNGLTYYPKTDTANAYYALGAQAVVIESSNTVAQISSDTGSAAPTFQNEDKGILFKAQNSQVAKYFNRNIDLFEGKYLIDVNEENIGYENGYPVSVNDGAVYYTYDNYGRLESVTNEEGTFIYIRDSIGRITSEIDALTRKVLLNISYGKDNLITISYGNGNNRLYRFDNIGNLISFTGSGDIKAATEYYFYNSDNSLIKTVYPQKGDVNFDGEINIADLIVLKKRVTNDSVKVDYYNSDLLNDGSFNSETLIKMRKIILQ